MATISAVGLVQSRSSLSKCQYNKYTASIVVQTDGEDIKVKIPVPYNLCLVNGSVYLSNSTCNSLCKVPYQFNQGIIEFSIPKVVKDEILVVTYCVEKLNFDRCQESYETKVVVDGVSSNKVVTRNACCHCGCECSGRC